MLSALILVNLGWALQEHGFDYCDDKRLYDGLRHEGAEQVRLHLLADANRGSLVRFLENHDEPRTASIVDAARYKALAVSPLTQVGARLVHHGQAGGWRVRLPVFLGRYPAEPTDDDLAEFYRSLWAVLRDPTFPDGRWRLCERVRWDGKRPVRGPRRLVLGW